MTALQKDQMLRCASSFVTARLACVSFYEPSIMANFLTV